MTTLFCEEQQKIFVAVDCIVLGFKQGKLFLLVTKRKFEPLKGHDSLMFGFLREQEGLQEAVSRVLYEYTGITDVYMEQVGAYGNVNHDANMRVLSIAYYALIDMAMFDDERCETHDIRWEELGNVGKLVFDHNQMLTDTLILLRRKATCEPIGFNLLPEKFTLPQLQSLYESLYQTTFDKRNFRKKILEMDMLEKQKDKDKSSSKRGAFYYKFIRRE
ncbi:NUDIX domain-containing protein [Parabacteroides sp. OttesenSCG-928-K15]|nr:NUDIX domain-containing protein [Parabacteroides sp. OttesenSCG-928-K15]